MNDMTMDHFVRLYNQRRAEAASHDVQHVRVTRSSFAGSVVCMPMSDDTKMRYHHTIADHSAPEGEYVEIPDPRPLQEMLIHPDDWSDLIRDLPRIDPQGDPLRGPLVLWGIPIVYDEASRG